MVASLSRKLIMLTSSRLLLLQNPNPRSLLKPFLTPKPTNPYHLFLPLKPFSSTPNPNPNPNPDHLKHQEIEGPTVDRDNSALANETRQALSSLRKSIYSLSSSLALLSFAHLGLGSYMAYSSKATDLASIQGLAAFAFPFSVAFLMRRSLKPMIFFQKMEEQGRLQILTLSLQSAKSLKELFVRVRVISVCCVVGISAGSLVVSLWLR